MPRRKRRTQQDIRQRQQELKFGAALAEVRQLTSQGITETIGEAELFLPTPLALSDPQTCNIQSEALFDGILDALSDRIIAQSYFGEAGLMAEQVAQRLIDIVEIKICEGRA